MTITTIDGLVSALANNATSKVLDKASLSNAAAGQFFSLWAASGQPGAGSAPGAAAVPTKDTTGGMPFTNPTDPVKSYLGHLTFSGSNSALTVEIHDRLAHMGGLSGTVTTSQGALSLVTSDPGAERRGASNYSDISWWLEIYTALGATGVNATVAVTYDDDTTGNLAAIALGATPRAGRLYQCVPAVAGKFIKAVTGVTLSATTGTAGNFGITATRACAVGASPLANYPVILDWAQLGLPRIADDACLMMLVQCSTTTTGTVRGRLMLAHG
jgi:hypothetical protein